MLERLKPYLSPPVFPDDEDKTFTASLLHVILWSVLLSIVLYILIAPIQLQPQRRPIAWAYEAALAGLILGLLYLTWRGKIRLAAIGINVGLWIILTVADYFNGGVSAPAYSGYLIVIICTGLLVSWQWGVLAAVASVMAGAFFLLANNSNWLPEWVSTYSSGAVWGANVAYFFAASVLLALALRTIKRASQQTRYEMAQRLKTEQALRHSEQRFRAIFDSVNDAIFVQDLGAGRILDVNKTMCEMYGYTVEEARQLSVEDLSSGEAPYTQQEALAWMQRAAAGQSQIFEWHAKDRAGRLFWVEVNMRRAVIDGQDRLLVVVRDLSARKETEAALRREKQFAEDIINSLPGIFYMYNERGELVRWNKLSELVTGYSASELMGMSILDFLAGEDQKQVAARLALAMEEGATDAEAELVTKDGQHLPYYLMGVRTELDNQAYLVGFGIDLSVRRRAEREVHQREAYLRSILDNFPYLVWLKDMDGRFLAVNEVFAQACRQPDAKAVVGKTDLDVWPRELAEKYRADDQSVMDTRVQKSVEEIVAAQGIERWFETYKSPIFDAHGNVIGTAGFARDITDRKQAAERERHVSQGLRAVIEAAQELIDCADLDTLYRYSVELARKELGLERCGLFLLDDRQETWLGTYGTNAHRQTSDEHTARVPVQDASRFLTPDDQLWWVEETLQTYWQGDAQQPVGHGWIATTPIRSRRRTIGVLYNDTAITHIPVAEAQQDVVAVYCSLLGNLIELKRTEAALAHERDLLQALMDNIPDLIYFKDTASRFTRVNQPQAMLLGAATPEEVVGKTDLDFQDSQLAQTFLAEEQDLIRTGQPIIDRLEYNPTPDGQPRWLTATKVPLRDAAGHIYGIAGITRDITARKRAEERELRASQGLRSVIESAQELIDCADLDTLYRRSVELAREKIGLERCGLHLLDDQLQYLLGTFGTDDRGQTVDERPARTLIPDSSPLLAPADRLWWVEDAAQTYYRGEAQQPVGQGWIAATPIRSRQRIIGMLYNDTAITHAPVDEAQQEVVAVYGSLLGNLIELKRTETALAHERDLLQALMDNIPDTIYFKDTASRFTRVNQAQARLLGAATPEEALGKTDVDFFSAELGQQFLEEEQRLMRTGELITDRLEYNPPPDGRPRWLSASKVPLRDASGQIIGLVGISRDVTDRVLAEEHSRTMSRGLRAVIESADELIGCADLDTLYRRTVELAREKLNIERCGLFLLDETGQLCTTYGTDLQRQTVDERGIRFTPIDPEDLITPPHQLWRILEGRQSYWKDGQMQVVGQGWRCSTFIRAHDRTMGVLFNDTAISQAPIDEAQQEVLAVYGSLLGSIIELKRAEEALRESEALYRRAIEAAGAVPYYLDYVTEAYRFVGAGIHKMTGLSAQEMKPSSWDMLIQQAYPWGDAHYLSPREAVQEARRGHINEWRCDYHVRTQDGHERWITDASVQILDEQGKPCGAIGILQDITDRKQVELALRESEGTMRALLDAIPDAIFRFDAQGVFKDYLPAKNFALLLPPSAFIGQPYTQVLPPEMVQQLTDNFQQVLEKGEARLYEYALPVSGQAHYYESRLVKMAQGDVLGIVRDVTDRKEAEQALQQREAYLRAILDNFPYRFWLKDTEGRYLAANRTLAQTLGLDAVEALIGKTDWDITPTVAAKHRADDQEVIDTRTQKFVEEIALDHGEERWFETFKSPIFDAQGGVLGTAGFSRDITARRQSEAAVRESEALFRHLADNAPALVCMTDEHGVATYLNRAWHTFRGPVSELPVEEWSAYVHPADRERYLYEFRSALQAKRKFTIEYRLQRADGQYRWLLDTVVPHYAADERFAGLIGIAIDITDRKNAEEALRRGEGRLRLLAENMADVVCQIDVQHKLVYVSPSVERVFGYRVTDLLGRRLMDLMEPTDSSTIYHQLIVATTMQVPSLRLVYRLRHVGGHYLWVESETRLLYDEAGEFAGAIFGSRDISVRKEAEEDREKLIRELEDKNAELERFTYTVSHDLKSPLITICGFLGFLEKDAAAGNLERLHVDLERITIATNRMQRLLDELLELSRVGRTINPTQAVDLGGVAREAVEVQGRIQAHGVQIEIDSAMPTVHGDRARLVEVMQNLVDNAVKFRGDQPEPRITIGAQDKERAGMPIFFVRDNGLGIDPQYHERVFGLFNKLDTQTEGTGVGLALVKRIVELHGGDVWVESKGVGHGATFFFTLPRHTAPDTTQV